MCVRACSRLLNTKDYVDDSKEGGGIRQKVNGYDVYTILNAFGSKTHKSWQFQKEMNFFIYVLGMMG